MVSGDLLFRQLKKPRCIVVQDVAFLLVSEKIRCFDQFNIFTVILGIFAAYGFGNLVAEAMPGGGDWGAVVKPTAILIAFTFAVGVGIVFGLFPAIKVDAHGNFLV